MPSPSWSWGSGSGGAELQATERNRTQSGTKVRGKHAVQVFKISPPLTNFLTNCCYFFRLPSKVVKIPFINVTPPRIDKSRGTISKLDLVYNTIIDTSIHRYLWMYPTVHVDRLLPPIRVTGKKVEKKQLRKKEIAGTEVTSLSSNDTRRFPGCGMKTSLDRPQQNK